MDQDLLAVLQPVVEAEGLELFDVDLRSGVLGVTVDREGGVDLDALTANRAVSTRLDELDPFPGPLHPRGVEPGGGTPLRNAGHFARAVGEQVTVRTGRRSPASGGCGHALAADEDGRAGVEGPTRAGPPRLQGHRPGPDSLRMGRPGPPGPGARRARQAGGQAARARSRREERKKVATP